MSFPGWLTPLPDAEAMRATDRWAIDEQGVPSLELMERAGAAVARTVERLTPDGPFTVVCGKGNNGGDGLVVARLLREAGHEVAVVCRWPTRPSCKGTRGEPRTAAGRGPLRLDGSAWAQGQDAPAAGPFERPAAIVDALLGTGFDGRATGRRRRSDRRDRARGGAGAVRS